MNKTFLWLDLSFFNQSYSGGITTTKSLPDIGGTTIQYVVHTMSDELILQISCNIFLAFKWILMMTSDQNISHYSTAQLSVHVWNHDLIWWQNKTDTQKHFRKTTITSSWTLSKTIIPITIVKARMPSNPNQKSRTRDNKWTHLLNSFHSLQITWGISTSEFELNTAKKRNHHQQKVALGVVTITLWLMAAPEIGKTKTKLSMLSMLWQNLRRKRWMHSLTFS